ncbi:MAG: ABC transporter substrate-binding protein [Proteobacteria bacterium]|nr:ABC transporter substrate-binding protein [Pseudomonadota bacterium]MBU1594112.1 ABC transporter substrate-binding protein [Pseudomonadota bacterium]
MRLTTTLAMLLSLLLLGADAAAQPRTRTLVFGRSADATFLDPAKFLDNESAMVIENVFDGLVRYADDSTRIEPALAEAWSVSENGLAYTFRLRRGVSFHDGSPMNAQAAQFSLLRKIDPAHPYFRSQFSKMDPSLGGVRAVEATSEHSLRITLKAPDPLFLNSLARHSCYIVSPAAVRAAGDGFDKLPVGTGPFALESWIKGERIILKANPRHFSGAPKIDTLVFKVVPDPEVRLLELRAGSIQAMDGLTPGQLGEVRRNSALTLDGKPGMNVGYLAMNTEHAPLDNPLVRRAIAHAINRPVLVKSIFQGMATQALTLVPPNMPGHDAKAPDTAYDPTQARRLLRQAGLAQGFETTLWAMPVSRPYMPQPDKIARFIQENLAAVGIRARIVTHDWATYLTKAYSGEHDLCLLGWISTGDAGEMLEHLLDRDNAVKPHASNISFFRDQRVHDLLAQAKATASPKAREELLAQVQEIAALELPLLPLAHASQFLARAKNVQGIVNHQSGVIRFAKASIR